MRIGIFVSDTGGERTGVEQLALVDHDQIGLFELFAVDVEHLL